jgi:transposase-like protein
MTTSADPPPYKRHRFPPELISHAVWLYFRFTRSYRAVEELLAARGIVVSYEAIQQWCLKFWLSGAFGEAGSRAAITRLSVPGNGEPAPF